MVDFDCEKSCFVLGINCCRNETAKVDIPLKKGTELHPMSYI